MKLSSQKTDLNAKENGVVLRTSPTSYLKVAMWDNKKHKAFKLDLFKSMELRIDAGLVTNEELAEKLLPEWQFILVDMVGYTDDENQPLVWSPDLVMELKKNPEYDEFFKRVEAVSKDEAQYRKDVVKSLGEDLPTS